MPLELGIWRIDKGVKPVEFGPIDLESRLEDILDEIIDIASPNWLEGTVWDRRQAAFRPKDHDPSFGGAATHTPRQDPGRH